MESIDPKYLAMFIVAAIVFALLVYRFFVWITSCHHEWIYGDRIRVCSKCSKMQHIHSDWEGDIWYEDVPQGCEMCNGSGKRATVDGRIIVCPECDGTGKA